MGKICKLASSNIDKELRKILLFGSLHRSALLETVVKLSKTDSVNSPSSLLETFYRSRSSAIVGAAICTDDVCTWSRVTKSHIQESSDGLVGRDYFLHRDQTKIFRSDTTVRYHRHLNENVTRYNMRLVWRSHIRAEVGITYYMKSCFNAITPTTTTTLPVCDSQNCHRKHDNSFVHNAFRDFHEYLWTGRGLSLSLYGCCNTTFTQHINCNWMIDWLIDCFKSS